MQDIRVVIFHHQIIQEIIIIHQMVMDEIVVHIHILQNVEQIYTKVQMGHVVL